ncbi:MULTISPECIES: type IV pilus twitching motility protein PilT [Dehalococcoides]|jgi:twitching motility protein PilT|uniref:Twitching motility protein PilT n=2 Tax=Dehalococcoides mccartyi TaxID=61435 RepID=A0A142VAH1_9CHLR|nr:MULTISPECIES: type IV pilus twitching motility protein PilT [Dehalococcoides]AGG06467.1 ATPase, PilT family [Dehalococcoides mccartyi DCMB5]AGG07906.1 ATPase, PilT family [Dehalococcoides mccartyi BTF08]AII60977.1 twitching motility protein PilT [Dehalococcoides mccartyi CG5]AMU86601.1 twitching motility protein PilT [Dehalococcoides mccartyi]AOV99425.1 twitching motility protein PilT [Dehalococcoides mccartyi]
MRADELLKIAVDKKASDLHLRVPNPPVLRIDGALQPQTDWPVMYNKAIEQILEEITTPEQREVFYAEKELDFAYSVPGVARFRVNVMRQRGSISIAFRQVPFQIRSIDELGVPQICKELILKPRGLILITGPTGSGKSTTMAAMVDHLNRTDARNIITIEDPIEYLYTNNRCIIAQRDLGDDTKSFSTALKHALRHDPDVILVGEMRDLETISTAISAAETGHLVVGTLHTTDAPQTIDRLIDIFPPDQQQQIRMQLSLVIEAVLVQTLLPKLGGKGRVAAFEIMVANTAVRNLIRDKKAHELHNVMQLSVKDGMQTLDQSLANLVRQNMVSMEEALLKSSYPERLQKLLQYQQTKQNPF